MVVMGLIQLGVMLKANPREIENEVFLEAADRMRRQSPEAWRLYHDQARIALDLPALPVQLLPREVRMLIKLARQLLVMFSEQLCPTREQCRAKEARERAAAEARAQADAEAKRRRDAEAGRTGPSASSGSTGKGAKQAASAPDPTLPRRDPWEVLGLQAEWAARDTTPVTERTVNKAFRQLALKAHPDKAPAGEKSAWELKFHELMRCKEACLKAVAAQAGGQEGESSPQNQDRQEEDEMPDLSQPTCVTEEERQRVKAERMRAAERARQAKSSRKLNRRKKASIPTHHPYDTEDGTVFVAIRIKALQTLRKELDDIRAVLCPCGRSACPYSLLAAMTHGQLATKGGSTLLHVAAHYGNVPAVELVKAYIGADLEALLLHKNNAGQLAYELAPEGSILRDLLYVSPRTARAAARAREEQQPEPEDAGAPGGRGEGASAPGPVPTSIPSAEGTSTPPPQPGSQRVVDWRAWTKYVVLPLFVLLCLMYFPWWKHLLAISACFLLFLLGVAVLLVKGKLTPPASASAGRPGWG